MAKEPHHDEPKVAPAHPAPHPAPKAGPGAAAEMHMTEQEKDKSGATPGVGPADASVEDNEHAETIEELKIGPRQPYPEGGAPEAKPGVPQNTPPEPAAEKTK